MVGGRPKAMPNMMRNEEGQALVEYALVIALVTIVAVGALTALGQSVNAILDYLQGAIADAVPGG